MLGFMVQGSCACVHVVGVRVAYVCLCSCCRVRVACVCLCSCCRVMNSPKVAN